jgi:hypothetical protein
MSERLAERRRAFTSQAPSQWVQDKMRDVREDFQDLAEMLDGCMPECREKSLGFTALEEAAMWFMKALSHTDPDATQASP